MSEKELGTYTLAEAWIICKTSYNCKGCPFLRKGEGVCPLGARPDAWTIPFLSKPERELLRMTGAKFVSRDESGPVEGFVCLWENRPKPSCCPPGFFIGDPSDPNALPSRLPATLFPSIPPGVCLDLASLHGGETEETAV